MTLAERIAHVRAERACADICRVLGRHSAMCPNARPAGPLSPFTRAALRGELPAKEL